MDSKDSIQAVVVKKNQEQPRAIRHTSILKMSTTLPTYKNENGARIPQKGNRNYKKRNPSNKKIVQGQRIQPNTTNLTGGFAQKIQLSKAIQSATTLTGAGRLAIQQKTRAIKIQAPHNAMTSVQKTSHNNYVILAQNVIKSRAQNSSKKDANKAKMLIFLASGGQRLITFNLPRESCDIQSLLQQIGVPFDNKTTVQCVDSQVVNIDFVVTVGFLVQESNTFVKYQSNNIEQPQSAQKAN